MATIVDEDAVALSSLSFRAEAKALHAALKILFTVAPKSDGDLPALRNLFLRSFDDKLQVTAFDLTIGARITLENVKVTSQGRALIDAAKFESTLKELSGEEILVAFDEDHHCSIKTPSVSYKIPCAPPSDYPRIPKLKGARDIEVSAPVLASMIDAVSFCAHTERGKFAINGVLVDMRDRRLRVVATNTKVLGIAQLDLPSPVADPVFAIVPTKVMNVLARSIADAEVASLSIGRTMIQMRCGQTTLFARLINGEYPPYDSVIPKNLPRRIRIPREALATTLRRAVLLGTGKKDKTVGLVFSNGALRVFHRNSEVGDADVSMALDYEAKDDVVIGFNAEHLINVLRSLTKKRIRFEFKNASKAVVLREITKQKVKLRYLVAPLVVVPD